MSNSNGALPHPTSILVAAWAVMDIYTHEIYCTFARDSSAADWADKHLCDGTYEIQPITAQIKLTYR